MLNNKILEAICGSTWALYKKTSWLKIMTDKRPREVQTKKVLIEADTIFRPFVSFGKQLVKNLWIIRGE